MKQVLTALFEYGWLDDTQLAILESEGINVKVYLVDEEPEMRIDISNLSNIQKVVLYMVLNKNIVEEIKNGEYTWLILYK